MLERNYVEDISISGRRAEIKCKQNRIYELLEEQNMEALLLRKHPNFSWITAGGKNFIANCFDEGAVAILVTKKGSYAICNVIEEPRIVDEEKLPELGFEIEVYKWQENGLEDIVKKYVFDMNKVISDVPCGSAIVKSEWIMSLRLQLMENEIARYVYLGDKMSEVLEEYMASIVPGMTEYEIAGGISKALWKYNIEQVMHLVSVDARADKYRHALPTDKKLEHNVIVSINGRYKGLITTISRMAYIGKIPQQLEQQYCDCCEMEVLTASKAAIGVDELELYNTLQQAYIDKGYEAMFDKHGQGGCQGYWPREYMITPTCHNRIKKNQAYCFNPVVDGTKSEDSFIVTEKGPLLITRPISYPKSTYNIGEISFERPNILSL
jgi:Xaa-Pro aminopeptidase